MGSPLFGSNISDWSNFGGLFTVIGSLPASFLLSPLSELGVAPTKSFPDPSFVNGIDQRGRLV